MDFKELLKRNHEIWQYYVASDIKRLGHEWSRGEYVRGLVGDVGALVKLTMGKDGLREIEDVDNKLAHELGDCLSCLMIVAEKYGVDLEEAFFKTMDELEKRGKQMDLARSHSL